MHPTAQGSADVADALVIFGISGDLARKMTLPSLYLLEHRGLLTVPVIGVASAPWSSDDLRQHAQDAVRASRSSVDEAALQRLVQRLSYVQGDFTADATFGALKQALRG